MLENSLGYLSPLSDYIIANETVESSVFCIYFAIFTILHN